MNNMRTNSFGYNYTEEDFSPINLPSQIPVDASFDLIERPSFALSEREDFLASGDNTVSVLRLLNYELSQFGFDPVYIDTNSKSSESLVKTLYSLLAQQHSNQSHCDDYEERLRRINLDNEKSRTLADRLKNKLELAHREVDSLKSKSRASEQELKTQTNKALQSREELKFTRADHQFNKNQFSHDIRKKDVELTKVKDKVQKIINDKYKSSKVSINILNAQSRPTSVMTSDKSLPIKASAEEHYYTELIRNYDEREKLLIANFDGIVKNFTDFYDQVTQTTNSKAAKQYKVQLQTMLLSPDGVQKVPESVNGLVLFLKETLDSLEVKKQPRETTDASSQTLEIVKKEPVPDPELLKQLEDQKKTIDSCNRELEDQKKTISSCNHELEDQKKTIYSYNRELEDQKKTTDSYSRELENLKKTIDSYNLGLEDQKKTINSFNRELEDLKNELGQEQEKVLLRDEQLKKMKLEMPVLTKEKDSLEKELFELSHDRSKFTEAAILLGEEQAQLLEEKAKLTREKERLSREKEKLAREKEAFFAQKTPKNVPATPEWLKDIDIRKINFEGLEDNLGDSDVENILQAGGKIFSPRQQSTSPNHLRNSYEGSPGLRSPSFNKGRSTKPGATAHHMLPTAAALLKARDIGSRQVKPGTKIPKPPKDDTTNSGSSLNLLEKKP